LAAAEVLADPTVAGAETAGLEQGLASRRPVRPPGELPPAGRDGEAAVRRIEVAPVRAPRIAEPVRARLWFGEQDPAADHAGVGMALEARDQRRHPVRGGDRIVVEEQQVASVRGREADV